MNRSLVDEAWDRLQAAVDRYAAAHASHAAALAHRVRAVARAERLLTAARGGRPTRRQDIVGPSRRIHTIADAVVAARAVRARPAVEAAQNSLDATCAAEAARVRATAGELDAAATYLRSFGAIGRQIVDAGSMELTADRSDRI